MMSTTHAGMLYQNSSAVKNLKAGGDSQSNNVAFDQSSLNIGGVSGQIGGGMLSQRSNSIRVANKLNMPAEGIEMLISQRRKKQTELQLKVLENRIKKLKEQEETTKAKSELKKKQIQQILLIRKRAQEEKIKQEERRQKND